MTFICYSTEKGKYCISYVGGAKSCYPFLLRQLLRCSSWEGETVASCMRSLSMSSSPPPLSANTCEKNYLPFLSLSFFFLLCISKLPKFLIELNHVPLAREVHLRSLFSFAKSFFLLSHFSTFRFFSFSRPLPLLNETRENLFIIIIHQKYSKEDNTSLMSLRLVPHLH